MNNKKLKHSLNNILFLFLLNSFLVVIGTIVLTKSSFGQSTEQKKITEGLNKLRNTIRYNQVNQLYQLNDYHLVWINCDHQKKILLELLYFSNDKGLNEKEYQFEFIRDYRSGALQFRNHDDSVNTDILLTDAALHFFSDLKTGNRSFSQAFN